MLMVLLGLAMPSESRQRFFIIKRVGRIDHPTLIPESEDYQYDDDAESFHHEGSRRITREAKPFQWIQLRGKF